MVTNEGPPARTARDEAAGWLEQAYLSRTPIEPVTRQLPGLTVDDAYAIQQVQVARWLGAGRVVRGHKVGLTALAMQRQLGVDQPDFGHLMQDMFHEPGTPVAADRFIQPRIEPEVAFVLSGDLSGPGVTHGDAAAAVAGVYTALEIIDSRIADWRITLVDTVADNASSGGVVMSAEPLAVDLADLPDLPCELLLNGQVVGEGRGRDVLGSPVDALAWLANRLGALGVPLKAGHVVLSGSFTAAAPVTAGDVVTTTFGGSQGVSARFA